jgi:nickel-dependent lactate racemase
MRRDMKLEIGFGTRPQIVDIPDANLLGVLEPNHIDFKLTGAEIVEYSLEHPVGTPRLDRIIHRNEKAVIITSDITRPFPTHVVLPKVLDELRRNGIRNEDIKIVFALGSHRRQTQEEMRRLVGENIYDEIECVDSDPDDFVHMGRTNRGTPVDITRVVAEADRRICLGNIEYHYFAGYSGGAKAVMPGVSTRAAIQANHSRMIQPEASVGRISGNPVREDLEEAIRYCPIDFIVNVVLDEHKKIVYSVAGHYIDAHRAGCAVLDKMYKKKIPERADIVLVSQGGAPKDLNLYQTQKALENAKNAVRPGGIVILVGSCKEGMGERVFEEWMITEKSPESIIERIQRDFRLGGHKAAAISLVLRNASIFLVSEMKADFVRSIFMTPFSSVQDAMDAAFRELGDRATVWAMPFGGSTLPVVETRPSP